ncbi:MULTISPECIES: hypothetical protein [Rhizobium]|uniref:hypothetical protein n=1 Tax=Rhizobium TaxID=379 RepID=UPI0007EA0587|nr:MULTISPECIES: hypothetical protein [Rhizobium]ANK95502.1 hypothetical protein AMK01_PD00623 [Rhizobium sp. N6212]ANL01554.1 hypothetical protein AMK00_PD00621 [Rhizobium sp. N621]ANL07682.1 hypothetical protein AMJ99_PD00628 [Rhizobium esperanzae]ANL13852.1 hypothetical protein AMJ98_PE00628 [Rhizobium sp. N1341]ANL25837.1 hypothetical protein AMJ96_PD00637 [Rhizobium sp. N113]
MEDLDHKPIEKAGADAGHERKVRVELEFETSPNIETLKIDKDDLDAVLKVARGVAGFERAHVFERDSDELLTGIGDRRAITLLVHRCRHIAVTIRYGGETHEREFSPAATVLRILHWAVGKHGFNLDDNAAAKANLIVQGSDQPLPKDVMIGRFAAHPGCGVALDLTLKDFTNG